MRYIRPRRPHRLTVRTAPFQGVNRGSTPREVTTFGTDIGNDAFWYWLSLPPNKESQYILAVPRASRAWMVRFKKYEAEDFGGKDFRKVCKSICAFAPPTRAHAPSIAVLRRNYKTAMLAPHKCD